VRSIDVVEGSEFSLPREEAERLRDAVERLRARLRPSFSLLAERGGTFRLTNVVGTIDLGGGLVLQVSPKVPVDDDWTTAVVSLLTGDEGIDLASERKAGTSQSNNKLLDAMAGIYLSRLQRAFRQEGPLVLMERVDAELSNLHGTLNVTKWARTAMWRPHIFPISRTELAEDNPFTRAIVAVADLLAHAASSQTTANGLRGLARDLSAGMPRVPGLPGGVTSRSLPEQWNAYKPAWSLAVAILSKTSLLGPVGHHTGVGLALEAWPLLETLLARTLRAAARVGARQGRNLTHQVQGEVELLNALGVKPQTSFRPQPDGRLRENGRLVASFEAKYSMFDGTSPPREHIYQALTTAAACGAPVAVLCYPNRFKPLVWAVTGFHGTPTHLVALGLDMFRWLPLSKVDERGEMLLDVLDNQSKATAGKVAIA
jgi:hypothetical protein